MQEGEYLLSHVGFSPDGEPQIILQRDDSLVRINPLGHTATLQFDTSQRHCRGWHDLETGKDSPCPDSQIIDNRYDQCPACQKRTGFNPAFYHAASVSPQQEARNQKPHFLYLAYFADDTVKVGISYAQRGKSRLLEQGARSALILDTFPTAYIARQYEAKIAALSGISETVQLSKKISHLQRPHDHQNARVTLDTSRKQVEEVLKVAMSKNDIQHFDGIYFPGTLPKLSEAYNCSSDHIISGKTVGMLGSLLFCHHQDTPVFLPLKKYVGNKVTITKTETRLNLPAQQASLF